MSQEVRVSLSHSDPETTILILMEQNYNPIKILPQKMMRPFQLHLMADLLLASARRHLAGGWIGKGRTISEGLIVRAEG